MGGFVRLGISLLNFAKLPGHLSGGYHGAFNTLIIIGLLI
jgi:hypothetical protein